MNAKQLLNKMPELLDAQAATGTDAVVQYDISEPVYQVLSGGTLEVFDGEATNPDLVVEISDDNLVALFKGELDAMSAFMMGKIKLRGDMFLAQKLVGFVDRDKLLALG